MALTDKLPGFNELQADTNFFIQEQQGRFW